MLSTSLRRSLHLAALMPPAQAQALNNIDETDSESEPAQTDSGPEVKNRNTPVRWGNNKKKVTRTTKNVKAKIAKASRRAQRSRS